MHTVLAEIHYHDQKDKVIDKVYKNGNCTEKERDHLKKSVSDLLSDIHVSKYFTYKWNVKTEKEILTDMGRTYVPDRLLFDKTSDAVIIIDYKTGIEKEKHVKQISDYAYALIEMGYNNVKKILIYTSKKNKIREL